MATIISPDTGANKVQDNVTISGTGGIKIPAGTTAQRPVSPATATLRYNITENSFEIYDGTEWKKINFTSY